MARPCCGRCWRTSAASPASAPWSARRARRGVRGTAPHRRRLCRERKTLVAEQVEHVSRIKGLLFAQDIHAYELLHRDRRQRLEELTTGDGRPLPVHLKAQIGRELDRLELLLRSEE